MTPEESRDWYVYKNAHSTVDRFAKTMLAAVCRDDEEVARLLILEAFYNNRDVAPVMLPEIWDRCAVTGKTHESWTTMLVGAEGQQRFYL